LLVLAILAAHAAQAQTGVSPDTVKFAAIKSFRIVQEKDGPALEILSTRPLTPSIKAMSGPDRLVIDLSDARLDTPDRRISVQADEITTLRADQFQEDPPITRIVVDLLAPRAYSWDAAGNRLVVHLGKNPETEDGSSLQPPTIPSLTPQPQPVVAAVRAAGPLVIAASDGSSGSTITAGAETTIVSLSSGGEIHVCPGTTLSVTPSHNRHNLMLSMNTGALEAHFALDASSDSVVTPDFRILLMGPGEFHYAISADNLGNTCVRSLPGNTASAMVNELLGDRTYQVKSTDQLVFRGGQLDHVDSAVPLECGCPPPRQTTLRAMSQLPTQNGSQPASNSNAGMSASDPSPSESAPSTGVAASPNATAQNNLRVQVEVPFVVHATGPPPASAQDARALPVGSRAGKETVLVSPLPATPDATAHPAAPGAAPAKRAPVREFFRKLGSFFSSLFS
jgi:hypothetical protein